MKFLHKIMCLLLFSVCSYGQTVFVTGELPPEEEKEQYNGKYIFSQFGFSIPLRVNPDRGEVIDEYSGDKESWFLPDGLSVYGGIGVHYKNWIGVAINTGIDWRVQAKLVSVPVYVSVIFNPQFRDGSGLLLEGGYGHAFALGRGDLSGAYTKYKIGFIADNEYCFYIDFSKTDISIHNFRSVNSVSIGISIFDFL